MKLRRSEYQMREGTDMHISVCWEWGKREGVLSGAMAFDVTCTLKIMELCVLFEVAVLSLCSNDIVAILLFYLC